MFVVINMSENLNLIDFDMRIIGSKLIKGNLVVKFKYSFRNASSLPIAVTGGLPKS